MSPTCQIYKKKTVCKPIAKGLKLLNIHYVNDKGQVSSVLENSIFSEYISFYCPIPTFGWSKAHIYHLCQGVCYRRPK